MFIYPRSFKLGDVMGIKPFSIIVFLIFLFAPTITHATAPEDPTGSNMVSVNGALCLRKPRRYGIILTINEQAAIKGFADSRGLSWNGECLAGKPVRGDYPQMEVPREFLDIRGFVIKVDAPMSIGEKVFIGVAFFMGLCLCLFILVDATYPY